MKRSRRRWLAALLGLSTACGSGHKVPPAANTPWTGATALSAQEEYPFGVVVHGTDVLYTTGLTVPGDHAVRIASLEPASPAASRVLAADPGGKTPNGSLAIDGGDVYVAAGFGIARVDIATGASVLLVQGRPSDVRTVAVDDRFVWWTTSSYRDFKGGEVARIAKHGGPVEVLAAGTDDKGRVYQDDPARQAVAVRGTSYFSSIALDGDTALVSSPEAILRVGAGRSPVVVADDNARRLARPHRRRRRSHLRRRRRWQRPGVGATVGWAAQRAVARRRQFQELHPRR